MPITLAELRRGVAVGITGVELGIDRVPGVVLADVSMHDPRSDVWMPRGQVLVRVWGGEGPRVWEAVTRSPNARGLAIVLEVHPVTAWARARAWWRWTAWRLDRRSKR